MFPTVTENMRQITQQGLKIHGDAEKNPNSRKLADVSNLPTFAFFKNGELVNEVQTNKADVLLNFVDEAANH